MIARFNGRLCDKLWWELVAEMIRSHRFIIADEWSVGSYELRVTSITDHRIVCSFRVGY